MKFLYLLATIVLSSICNTNARVVSGSCATAPVLTNFDATKYTGTWFEIQRNPSSFESGLKCVKAQYDLFNSSTIIVKNSGIKISDGSKSLVEGYATVPNINEPNKLSVVFPFQIGNLTTIRPGSPYNVWKTDYSTYSLVYSCTQILTGILKSETAWVLSRFSTMSFDQVEELKAILQQNGVDTSAFELVDQSTCQ